MLLRHSFFLLIPGIKTLGWHAPDCPGPEMIKIEMMTVMMMIIIIIAMNVMKAFYVLPVSVLTRSHWRYVLV